MPSKFDKISFVVSIVIVLPVAVGIIWLDVMSGMWKSDLVAMVGIGVLIILGVIACWIGHSLRGKIHPTKENLNLCMQGGMFAIVSDCAMVFLAAFTVGYQPWLIWGLLPLLLIGVACLAAAALLRGSMQELR